MQALMCFNKDLADAVVANEDIEEELKEMLKEFHTNLMAMQQIVQV